MIAIEVAAPAKGRRLPSQMARGSMAQAMGYPVVIMLLTNTLAIVNFETLRVGCQIGVKTASLDENFCSFARLWTTAAAVSKAPSITTQAQHTDRLPGSRPLMEVKKGPWNAEEDDKLRGAVDEFGAGRGAQENTWQGRKVKDAWARSLAALVLLHWLGRSATDERDDIDR